MPISIIFFSFILLLSSILQYPIVCAFIRPACCLCLIHYKLE